MIVKSRKPWELPYSEVTPEWIYRSRREFIKAAAGTVGALAGAACMAEESPGVLSAQTNLPALTATRNGKYVAVDRVNSYKDITTYNNYYEFGTEKSEPARNAGSLKTTPWTVQVDGMVGKPGKYAVDDLIDFKALEERIYRHRCVEVWSMVMPFIGVPMSSVIRKVEPLPSAKFVEFTTLRVPNAPDVLDWPYVEALRLDEAMNELTFMVVGLYGHVLPNQCGAPLRVHIPWKYGFKSGKSIVRLRFTDKQPATTWNMANPPAYGFYANVNPTVARPWDQSREIRLPGIFKNRDTEMFNGYRDQVASLYSTQDLKKDY